MLFVLMFEIMNKHTRKLTKHILNDEQTRGNVEIQGVQKTITILISIYFYITTQPGMHVTYTIREINIL